MKTKYAKSSYESLAASNYKLRETVENLYQRLLATSTSQSECSHDSRLVETFFSLPNAHSTQTQQNSPTNSLEDFEPYDLAKCEPVLPSPGLAHRSISGEAEVWGILCIRLKEHQVHQLVELVSRLQSEGIQFIPVFLTEMTEVAAFVRNGLVFELLPTGFADREKGNWIKYRSIRLELLIAKYGISRLVNVSDLQAMLNTD
jgi:hypothetical protein